MRLFEIAVIYNPKKDTDIEDKVSSIVVPITSVLAKDLTMAQMLAARLIPDAYANKLDQIEVVVRPF